MRLREGSNSTRMKNLPLPRPWQGQIDAIRSPYRAFPLCVHPVYHTFASNRRTGPTMKAAVRPGRSPNGPVVRYLSRILSCCLVASSLKHLSLSLILSLCRLFHRLANSTTCTHAALRFPICDHLDARRSFPLSTWAMHYPQIERSETVLTQTQDADFRRDVLQRVRYLVRRIWRTRCSTSLQPRALLPQDVGNA